MKTVVFLLCIMLISMIIWFLILKRPAYEAVFISLVVILFATGTWGNIGVYIHEAFSSSLLYSMTAFIAMSIILTKTKIIDGCIMIILALVGRLAGGAGYVSILASTFMGALSGSGPGNVMATGAFTIPAMKKTGYPAELAAMVEVNSSCLGNMIPPSANIVAAMGAFYALYPDSSITSGAFWIVLWGCSIWFILKQIITLWVFCKYYNVKPMPKEEIPKLKDVLKKYWQGLLLPVIVILPFVLDYLFKNTFFTDRLGATGAKYMSSSMLLFIAGISSMYACAICKDKKMMSPRHIARILSDGVKSICPTVFICVIGYTIGGVFADLNIAGELETYITSMQISKLGMVLLITVLTSLLGMVITGSSMIVVFGSTFIIALTSVGVEPILAAAMLPCLCGVMSNILPPLAPGFYAGMLIAESDFGKTVKNDIWWIVGQFLLEVIVLMGWLPILGM